MTVMSAETRALLDGAKATCKISTERLTTSLPWVPKPRAVATDGSWDPVKAQVREICTGIKIGTARVRAVQSVKTTRAFRSDLQRFAAEVQAKPTPRRSRRHYLTDPAEMSIKLREETGFDTLGRMVEPPQEQWARPEAQTLYAKLMLADPGRPTVAEFAGPDLQHLAWMCEAELLDIDDAGHIHMLSDEIPPGRRRYLGAPVDDERARIGRTHAAEDVQAFVLEIWNMISDGRPPMDIDGDHRQEMTTAKGIRISGSLMTTQANKLLAARIDSRCNCLGRTDENSAWDLPDHGEGCAGRERWLSIDVVRRAIRELMKSGALHRVAEAILTRRGHTEHRKPAAYEIAPDAGWHAYAAKRRTARPKPMSRLRVRLLGDAKQAAPPLPDLEEAA